MHGCSFDYLGAILPKMTKISSQRRNDLISLCLVLVTLAVYWPVRQFQFVNYDDGAYVYLNPPVRSGVTLNGLAWAFTTFHQSNWHPLTWISHMLDCQFFGLDAGAHHLVNVFIHIAVTVLLFQILNRMTAAPWRSAFVAALFALHPLHVESVAWIAERKDVLSTFFWMLTLWAYVRYVEKLTVRSSQFTVHYVLALVFFMLGLMAKPMLVTLPFVLLLLDYWPLGRTPWAKPAVSDCSRGVSRGGVAVENVPSKPKLTLRLQVSSQSLGRLVMEKVPFLVLALASSAVTVWAQSGEAISSLQALPLGTRLANAVVAYPAYLGKTFWPSGLAVFYPYPQWPLGVVVGSGAILLGVSALVIWNARRSPQFLVGWLWFLGTLVPVIGLIQVGGQSFADRYTYLPSIGLFLMAGWSLPNGLLEHSKAAVRRRSPDRAVPETVGLPCPELAGRPSVETCAGSETLAQRALLRQVAAVAAITLLAAFAVVCRAQVLQWENTETLFRHALAVTKNNWLAHYNLGVYLMQQGRLDDAIAHYEQAVRIRPNYFEAHNNMAFALRKAGRLAEAIDHWEQALHTWPNNVEVNNNLGLALLQAGKVQEAIEHFQQALLIKPDAAATHFNLGLALEHVGKTNDAISHYERALRLRPDLMQAHDSLARLRAMTSPTKGNAR